MASNHDAHSHSMRLASLISFRFPAEAFESAAGQHPACCRIF